MATYNNKKKLVIGVDYGTDSVRAVLIDTQTGEEISSDVFNYPRWANGLYCDPSVNQYRQHPLDYLEGLETSITNTLKNAFPKAAEQVAAISIDTTGSTPVAVDEKGTALALRDDLSENPNAMFILWKDHTALKEADEINKLARSWGGEDYTRFSGGIYSTEWYWAKILRTLRVDQQIQKTAYSWVEHCDWIPAVLTGTESPSLIKRSRCAAGHKAMWHESWGGLPSDDFLTKLDPLLSGIRDHLYQHTETTDKTAGYLTEKWADKTGLIPGIPIGIGAFDAHMGAVGGQIKPYSLVKVIGTSTCDILTVPADEIGDTIVKGICGQVDGSVTPDVVGLEAGQSAFGDIYAWFSQLISWPLKMITDSEQLDPSTKDKLMTEISDALLSKLSDEAANIEPTESDILALDWHNGRRTPDANQSLKGVIAGLNLSSDAPAIFKALVSATAFGAKAIVERFLSSGIPIKEIIAIGGVAKKSHFAMQTLADVLNMEIKVARSEQTVALGAAIFAARVAGIFDSVELAQEKMGSDFEKVYRPNPLRVPIYEVQYEKYKQLGEFEDSRTIQGH